MDREQVIVLFDLEYLEMFSTYGGKDALIYNNSFIRSESKLSSRHPTLVTLVVL